MNIAFQALVIFLLTLPGIVLRYGYRRGLSGKAPQEAKQISEEIAYGVLFACLIHAVLAPLVHYGVHPVDLPAIARSAPEPFSTSACSKRTTWGLMALIYLFFAPRCGGRSSKKLLSMRSATRKLSVIASTSSMRTTSS